LKDKNKISIIGAVALVLIIAAIAGFYYMQESDKNKVEEAVKLHIEYYNTRNIDAYYDLVSQTSKDKYDIKLEDISNLLNKAAFDGTNITIVNISKITVQGENAEVTGVIIAKNNQGSETRSFVELYKKENGVWKYEQRMWEDTATSEIPQQ
jgi:type II secretory pathway pseudopilin PulG